MSTSIKTEVSYQTPPHSMFLSIIQPATGHLLKQSVPSTCKTLPFTQLWNLELVNPATSVADKMKLSPAA